LPSQHGGEIVKTLPAADIVIIGGGWTGLLIAKELGQRTSSKIVVLERGAMRKTNDYSNDMDELDYFKHGGILQYVLRQLLSA